MKRRYVFDKDSLSFRKERLTLKWLGGRLLSFVLLSLSLTVAFYLAFSLLFNTKEEAALKEQNRAYGSQLPKLQEKSDMLSAELQRLSARDNFIYREIFLTDAPRLDMASSTASFSGIDTIPDGQIVKYAAVKIDALFSKADRIEANMKRVLAAVSAAGNAPPPLHAPIEPLSYAQIGASVGNRINPYYKVEAPHSGLDIISEADVPVLASAGGIVSGVTRSMKGQGNVVEISHDGGYTTRYAHLAAINVRKGMRVRRGDVIGRVGISGNAYAPHLHYEVLRDTMVLNPVNHFFASVSPEEYFNMMIMSMLHNRRGRQGPR